MVKKDKPDEDPYLGADQKNRCGDDKKGGDPVTRADEAGGNRLL